jgi:hypothetical protein
MARGIDALSIRQRMRIGATDVTVAFEIGEHALDLVKPLVERAHGRASGRA